MRGTILHKLLKWIVASSVSLLALPISVFIIIFSLYPDLATVNDVSQLKSYYDICDIARKDTLVSEIDLLTNRTNTTDNHYLFIDATLSTKIPDNDKGEFKNTLKKHIESTDTLNGKSFSVDWLQVDDSIKKYLYYNLIKNYVITNNFDTLFIYFYKGETCFVDSNLIKLDSVFLNNGWYKSKIKDVMEQPVVNQQTNFRNIIDSIVPKFVKDSSNNILTIFSDFYHDDIKNTPKVLYRDFIYFQNNVKIKKYNFIALWSDEQTTNRKISQIELLGNFQMHLDGVKNTDYILIDRYTDNNFSTSETQNLELLTLFNNIDKRDTILFSAIATNNLGYDEGVAKIVLDKEKINIRDFHWCIKHIFAENHSLTKYRIYEEKNNKEDVFLLQNMDEIYTHPHINYTDNAGEKKRYFHRPFMDNHCDSLTLYLKLDDNCNYDDYKVCICVLDSNKYYYTECDIKIKKVFIEDGQKDILTNICDIFCILLIIGLIAGEWLFCQCFYDYKQWRYQHNLSSLVSWILGIVILGILLCCLFCIVCSAHYLWLPKIILFIIALMLIGKTVCFTRLISPFKLKWKQFANQLKIQINTKKRNYTVNIRKKRYNRKKIVVEYKQLISSKTGLFKTKIKSYINKLLQKSRIFFTNIKDKILKSITT